jgi:hypothetical protein
LVALIRRHEALRTAYGTRHGGLTQEIATDAALRLRSLELTGTPERFAKTGDVIDSLRSMIADPFDLSERPILRALHVRFTDSADSRLVLVSNHSIIDGWSMHIVRHDTARLIASRSGDCLGPARQYRDVLSQRAADSDRTDRQRSYWLAHLRDIQPRIAIPTCRDRMDVRRERLTDTIIANAEPSWHSVLSAAQRCSGYSVSNLYLAGLAASLAGFCDGEVVIGNVYSNRKVQDYEAVGLLFNVLPMRIRIEGDATIRELLRNVSRESLMAYRNGEIAMETIAEELGFGRAVVGGGPPLWEAALNVGSDTRWRGAEALAGFDRWLHEIEYERIMERWDGRILELIAKDPSGRAGSLRYNTEIIDEATASLVSERIERFFRRLPNILDAPVCVIAD